MPLAYSWDPHPVAGLRPLSSHDANVEATYSDVLGIMSRSLCSRCSGRLMAPATDDWGREEGMSGNPIERLTAIWLAVVDKCCSSICT